jgi:hypothetical protein
LYLILYLFFFILGFDQLGPLGYVQNVFSKECVLYTMPADHTLKRRRVFFSFFFLIFFTGVWRERFLRERGH